MKTTTLPFLFLLLAAAAGAEVPCERDKPCTDAPPPFAFPTASSATVVTPSTSPFSISSSPFSTGFGAAYPPSAVSGGNGAPAPTDGIKLSPSRMQVMTERYPSGEVAAERRTYDGKPDGLTKEFYKNGQVMYEWNYSLGQLEGESRAFYRNGDPMSELHYKKGNLHGTARHYYPRKVPKAVEDYKDGVLLRRKSYAEDGTLLTDEKPQEH